MGKNTFFTGQQVLNQLLSLLDRNEIRSIARRGDYDRYYLLRHLHAPGNDALLRFQQVHQ